MKPGLLFLIVAVNLGAIFLSNQRHEERLIAEAEEQSLQHLSQPALAVPGATESESLRYLAGLEDPR